MRNLTPGLRLGKTEARMRYSQDMEMVHRAPVLVRKE